MMNMEQFKKAVDSLAGYDGIVGVMGGEPTLNPDFPEMIRYLHKARPSGKKSAFPVAPVRDFDRFLKDRWNNAVGAKRGLWSTFGKKYYENLEAIADIFPYQCLNDHQNASMHQALLIPRKELGIGDEEWIKLRDKCWIQNEWSASITPKGAFFCEVAAALDMLFDGPGGWPVEPGWWKRKPEDFGDQLKWCEYCSAALDVPRISGDKECDMVSAGIWEKIKERNAWKVRNNRCTVFDASGYDPEKYKYDYTNEPYLPNQDIRISKDTCMRFLYPRDIAVVLKNGAALPQGEKFHQISEEDAAGLDFSDWLLVIDGDISDITAEFLEHAVFNPGVLYFAGRGRLIFINKRASALAQCKKLPLELDLLTKLYPGAKRYNWKNHLTPDSILFSEKIAALKRHIQDCWRYRSGLLLKKLGLKK